jgi:transposase InsO family protein
MAWGSPDAYLQSAARRFGPPRHLVTDRGAQFTSELFGRTVAALGIRHRFGAVGKAGSIALIERFFRTVKDTMAVRLRPPLLLDDLVARLEVVLVVPFELRQPYLVRKAV